MCRRVLPALQPFKCFEPIPRHASRCVSPEAEETKSDEAEWAQANAKHNGHAAKAWGGGQAPSREVGTIEA